MHDDAFDGFLPRLVLDAMRASHRDLLWLVRLHPRSSHLVDAVAEWLREAGVANAELRLSTRLPIDDLFDLARCVVVKYSVAGLEAASLGLPVVTYHAAGAATYADYIGTKHVAYAPSPDALVAFALNGEAPGTPLPYVDLEPGLVEAALVSTRRFFGRKVAGREA
jgi:hypothetical protein